MATVMSTVPSATPEPVSWSVSQASATKWNWSPSSEMLSPLKTNRKSRSRSGWISAKRDRATGSTSAPAGGSLDSGKATVSGFTLSFHADDDAVAVFVLDVQDGPRRLSCDGRADAVALLVGETRHHAQRGVREGQRDAQVHDLAAPLADADPQLAWTVARC